MTREEWLNRLTDKMRPMFEEAGEMVPADIRLTCGWPSKGAFASKSRTVGECWAKEASADKHVEVFISPCIGDALEVAAILAHELVHATGAMGHKAPFKRIAKKIGLEGPMRATKAGEELKVRLNGLISELGAYPHAALDKRLSPHKKDGTRLIKIVCPTPDCGYTARTTQKWLDVGFPDCPCGTTMALAE